jgi:hypothetical protein
MPNRAQVIGREDDFSLGEQGFLLAMAMYRVGKFFVVKFFSVCIECSVKPTGARDPRCYAAGSPASTCLTTSVKASMANGFWSVRAAPNRWAVSRPPTPLPDMAMIFTPGSRQS